MILNSNKPKEYVGDNCFTRPDWNRKVCQMRREEIGEHRWYTDDKDWYKGVSGFVEDISKITREDKFLNNWKKTFTAKLESGEDSFNEWMNGLADFGTLTHEAFNAYLMPEGFTLTWLRIQLAAFQDKFRLSELAINAAHNKTVKNVLSLAKFINEHQVEVYACEQMFKSKRLKTATPCDIVGRGLFQTKKGGTKVDSYVFANIKSSEASGRFSHHKWQCLIELLCGLESILPNLEQGVPICTGTVRTTDWRDEPTTDFKPYWFVNWDEEYNPIITSYEGENAAESMKIIDAIFSVKDNYGGFKTPKIKTYLWSGAMEQDTKLIEKDYFSLDISNYIDENL
jgi:hypothetical protein